MAFYSSDARLSSPPCRHLIARRLTGRICRRFFATKESNFTICPEDLQQQLFTFPAGAGPAASRFALPVILNVRRLKQTSTWSTSFHSLRKCTVERILSVNKQQKTTEFWDCCQGNSKFFDKIIPIPSGSLVRKQNKDHMTAWTRVRHR